MNSPSSATSDQASGSGKSIADNDPYAIPIGDDDTVTNETYPLFHYEDIQRQSNNTNTHDNANITLSDLLPEALQKNLSTTKTPFLPSETKQPEEWPKIVGGLFLVVTVGLLILTIVRKVQENNRRKNYEEIQNLVV